MKVTLLQTIAFFDLRGNLVVIPAGSEVDYNLAMGFARYEKWSFDLKEDEFCETSTVNESNVDTIYN